MWGSEGGYGHPPYRQGKSYVQIEWVVFAYADTSTTCYIHKNGSLQGMRLTYT